MTNFEMQKEIRLVELVETHFEAQDIGALRDLLGGLKIFSLSLIQQDEEDLSLILEICSLGQAQKTRNPERKNLTKKITPLLISWRE